MWVAGMLNRYIWNRFTNNGLYMVKGGVPLHVPITMGRLIIVLVFVRYARKCIFKS